MMVSQSEVSKVVAFFLFRFLLSFFFSLFPDSAGNYRAKSQGGMALEPACKIKVIYQGHASP